MVINKLLFGLFLIPILSYGDTQDMFNGNAPPRNVTIKGTTVTVLDAAGRTIKTKFKCEKNNNKPIVKYATVTYANGTKKWITHFMKDHLIHDHEFMLKLHSRIC